MITAFALNAGGSALVGGAVGIAWCRRRQRRTDALRARYEDAYELLVAQYGRLRAERLMQRSLDRFERHVRLLLLPGVSDPTSPSTPARWSAAPAGGIVAPPAATIPEPSPTPVPPLPTPPEPPPIEPQPMPPQPNPIPEPMPR